MNVYILKFRNSEHYVHHLQRKSTHSFDFVPVRGSTPQLFKTESELKRALKSIPGAFGVLEVLRFELINPIKLTQFELFPEDEVSYLLNLNK